MATAQLLPPVEAPVTAAHLPAIPPIRANHGPYLTAARTGRLLATALDTPLEEMKMRFRSHGYLFVKALIPREDVLQARESYFNFMNSTNIIKPGSDPRDGVFNDHLDPLAFQGIGGTLADDDEQLRTLVSAHNTPDYLAFSRHPALFAFAAKLMGWDDVVQCKRTLLRHNVPGSLSTAIHYDKIFLRAGEAEFLTAWVPIGDCAANGGGLLYLEDSVKLGQDIEAGFSQRSLLLPPEERVSAYNSHMSANGTLASDATAFAGDVGCYNRWLTADYEAGDVVFHDPYIIHASGKNEDANGRIRLSTDLRFYQKGPGIDERWMKPWDPDDRL